jgi:hypothetical protein
MKFNLPSYEELMDWKIGQITELQNRVDNETNPMIKNWLNNQLHEEKYWIEDKVVDVRDTIINKILKD